MKRLSLALTGLVLAACSAQAAGVAALQHDDTEVGRRFNMIRVYLDTRHCMTYASATLLRIGGKTRVALISRTVELCGADFRAELTTNGGYTAAETEPLLRELAATSLDEVLSAKP